MGKDERDFWDELRRVVGEDMEATGMWQSDYAEKIGCTQQILSRWLTTPGVALKPKVLNKLMRRLRKRRLIVQSMRVPDAG